MKFKNHITLAVRRSKVCSVWGLCEICFSLHRNLALSVLATGLQASFYGTTDSDTFESHDGSSNFIRSYEGGKSKNLKTTKDLFV